MQSPFHLWCALPSCIVVAAVATAFDFAFRWRHIFTNRSVNSFGLGLCFGLCLGLCFGLCLGFRLGFKFILAKQGFQDLLQQLVGDVVFNFKLWQCSQRRVAVCLKALQDCRACSQAKLASTETYRPEGCVNLQRAAECSTASIAQWVVVEFNRFQAGVSFQRRCKRSRASLRNIVLAQVNPLQRRVRC